MPSREVLERNGQQQPFQPQFQPHELPAVRAILTQENEFRKAHTLAEVLPFRTAPQGSPRRELWEDLTMGVPAEHAFERHANGIGWDFSERTRQVLIEAANVERAMRGPQLPQIDLSFEGSRHRNLGQGPVVLTQNPAQAQEVQRFRSQVNEGLRATATQMADLEMKGLRDTPQYHEAEVTHRKLMEKILAPEQVQALALARAEAFHRLTDLHTDDLSPEYQQHLSKVANAAGAGALRPAVGGRFAGWQRDEAALLTPLETSRIALLADPNHVADYHQGVVTGRIKTDQDHSAFVQALDADHAAALKKPLEPGKPPAPIDPLAAYQVAPQGHAASPAQGGPQTPADPSAGFPTKDEGVGKMPPGPPSSFVLGDSPGPGGDRVVPSVVLATPDDPGLARLSKELDNIDRRARNQMFAQGALVAGQAMATVAMASAELMAMAAGKSQQSVGGLLVLSGNQVLGQVGDSVRFRSQAIQQREEATRARIAAWDADRRQQLEAWREQTRNQIKHLQTLPVPAPALDRIETAMVQRRLDHPEHDLEWKAWRADHLRESLESMAAQMSKHSRPEVVQAGSRLQELLARPNTQAQLHDIHLGGRAQVQTPNGTQLSAPEIERANRDAEALIDELTDKLRKGQAGSEKNEGAAFFRYNVDLMETHLRDAWVRERTQEEIRQAMGQRRFHEVVQKHLGPEAADQVMAQAGKDLGPTEDVHDRLAQAYETKWRTERELVHSFVKVANQAPAHAQMMVEEGVTPETLLAGVYKRPGQVLDREAKVVEELRVRLRGENAGGAGDTHAFRPRGWDEGSLGGGRIGLAKLPGGGSLAVAIGYKPDGRFDSAYVYAIPDPSRAGANAPIKVQDTLVARIGENDLKNDAGALARAIRNKLDGHYIQGQIPHATYRDLATQLIGSRTPSGLAQLERRPGAFVYPRPISTIDPDPRARLEGDFNQVMARSQRLASALTDQVLEARSGIPWTDGGKAIRKETTVGPDWIGVLGAHRGSGRAVTLENATTFPSAGHQAAMDFLRRQPRP